MANEEVVKSFLVSLGFKTSEPDLRKFKEGIGQATKSVLALGAAAAATAGTVAYAMQRFSANLEQLYFSSLRTNTSVRNLKTLEVAAQNLGANAGEATQAIEALSRAYMENPFRTEALLKSMGVNTRDASGQLRTWKDQLFGTQGWFQRMPTNLGTARAAQLGIPYNLYLELQRGLLQAEDEQVSARTPGSDETWKNIADKAHKFEEDIRNLRTAFEYLGGTISEHLGKKFNVTIESMTRYLATHADEISAKINHVIDVILGVSKALEPAFKAISEWYTDLDRKSHGWLTGTLAILATLQLLGATKILGGILGLAGGVLSLSAALITAGAAAAPLLAAIAAIAAAAAWMSSKENFPKSFGQAAAQFKWGTARATTFLGQGGSSGVGLSPEQKSAAAHFKSMLGLTDEQTRAMVGVLGQESGVNLDPEAVGDNGRAWGIGQWHADRQAQFWTFMKSLGINPAQFHALKDPATKRSFEESFIGRELMGSEKPVLDALMKSGDYRQAFDVFGGYERSSNWQKAFPGGLKDVPGSTTNNVIFNGPVTSTEQMLKAVRDGIKQATQAMGSQISRDSTAAR
jgi:hypothetical protein